MRREKIKLIHKNMFPRKEVRCMGGCGCGDKKKPEEKECEKKKPEEKECEK